MYLQAAAQAWACLQAGAEVQLWVYLQAAAQAWVYLQAGAQAWACPQAAEAAEAEVVVVAVVDWCYPYPAHVPLLPRGSLRCTPEILS